MEESTKTIISVFGTETEKAAMRKKKNATAGSRLLSWSDFILEQFGVRKSPEQALGRLERKAK